MRLMERERGKKFVICVCACVHVCVCALVCSYINHKSSCIHIKGESYDNSNSQPPL